MRNTFNFKCQCGSTTFSVPSTSPFRRAECAKCGRVQTRAAVEEQVAKVASKLVEETLGNALKKRR